MSDNLKEREEFEELMLGKYGNVYSKEDVDRFIKHGHISWLAFKAGRAAIEADRVSRDVPAGWKLVPIEPTEAMLFAIDERTDLECGNPEMAKLVFSDLLAASPQPQPVQATYTAADVTAAHTDGYKLGMAQAAQPVQAQFCTHPKCLTAAGCKGVCQRAPAEQAQKEE